MAVVTRFVPVDYIEGAGVIGEILEGEGRAGGGIVLAGIVLADFRFEGLAFDRPNPHKSPARRSHGLDQTQLGFGLGIELARESGEYFVEGFGVLVFEDNGFREDAMTEIVIRGFEAAGARDRSVRSAPLARED